MTVKERLIEYIKTKKINIREFWQQAGAFSYIVQDYKVSVDWLLTGRVGMFQKLRGNK